MRRAARRFTWATGLLGMLLLATGCEQGEEVDNPRFFLVLAENASTGELYRDANARFTCHEWTEGEVLAERWDDRCALYVLRTTDGIELRFPGPDALAEGRTLHTEDGDLLIRRGKARGDGWVSLSRTRTINGADGYFVDIAGGFEIEIEGERLHHGVFHSRKGDFR